MLKLQLGAFYIHYKHDPTGEPGNNIYQVLNISSSKDLEIEVVTYRPLYKSPVFQNQMGWDIRTVDDWFKPAEKNGVPVERYKQVPLGSAEHQKYLQILYDLYPSSERLFYPAREVVLNCKAKK